MNDTDDRSDVSVRNPASNPALKRLGPVAAVCGQCSFYGYGMATP